MGLAIRHGAGDVRLKLTIAYDGAGFAGWQSQPFRMTVQDGLEDALKRITGKRVIVHGSGRTDTGVHALGQVAHIVVTDRFSVADWKRILNFNLPETIRVMECELAPAGFNAPKGARGKVYRYLIRNQEVVYPHETNRVWLVPQRLDLAKLRAAGRIFVGKHDFSGFSANREVVTYPVRTISRLAVVKKGTLIEITVEGSGFLYRMVRMLVASMVRVAEGKDELAVIEERLRGPGAPVWAQVAPPGGLYLVRVVY